MFRHLLECSSRDSDPCNECLLGPWLADLRTLDGLTQRELRERSQLSSAVERLLTRGYTLRRSFPRAPADLQSEWLGRRLVFGHSRWFLADVEWTSIVSSRLGRYGRWLNDWPALLELLLRSIRRAGSVYLDVSDTTVAPLVEPLLVRSAMPQVRVCLPAANESDVAGWLISRLSWRDRGPANDAGELHLSPELPGASSPLQRWPLQDRVAIACAQKVRALIVRPQGAIAHLLSARLADSRLGTGSVSVWMPNVREGQTGLREEATVRWASQLEWLERGAVGWYVAPRQPPATALGCRQGRLPETALWQLTSPYALCCSKHSPPEVEPSEDKQPRYLVHCVRGAQGALPPAAVQDLITQMWLARCVPDDSPLVTLIKILESGTLRGRSALNRTGAPCVSFSAVPLDQLVQRRAFQPHLGRWDWEPFGLMIQRRALERLGARPVIYGHAETYRQLSADQRAFFQPARRRRRADFHGSDWQEECEWRLVGDVQLSDLPRSAVHVFVAHAVQAQSLARHSAWPVIWLQDAQTLAPPARSKRRPRREVRTSRS